MTRDGTVVHKAAHFEVIAYSEPTVRGVPANSARCAVRGEQIMPLLVPSSGLNFMWDKDVRALSRLDSSIEISLLEMPTYVSMSAVKSALS